MNIKEHTNKMAQTIPQIKLGCQQNTKNFLLVSGTEPTTGSYLLITSQVFGSDHTMIMLIPRRMIR